MKNLILFLIILFSYTFLSAQNSDCGVAITICEGDSILVSPNGFGLIEEFTTSHNISNPATNPNASPGNFGCLLSGELNSTWIKFTIVGSGTLEFSLGTLTMPGCLDWIMWPYDSTTCSGIFNNTLPPVACNWNGACSGLSGMAANGNLPTGATQSDFEYGLNVNAGDQFILCFSNYSAQNFYLPFSSFGTSSFICSSGGVSCDSSSLTIDSVTVTNDECFALCNGAIVVVGSDIADSISYTLNNSISNYSGVFDSLCVGNYNLDVEDSLGCIISSMVLVNQNSSPIITLSDTSFLSCVGVCDTVSVSGAQNYSWLQNNSVISNDSMLIQCPDTIMLISVVGTDAVGCVSDTQYVSYNVPVNYGFITPQIDTVILGDSISLCLNNVDSSSIFYWFNGNSNNCTSFAPTTSGNYCAYIIDSCGHADTICSMLIVGDTTSVVEHLEGDVQILNTITTQGFFIEIKNRDFAKVQLTLFEQTGKIIFKRKINSEKTFIDISTLPAGLYIAVIWDDKRKLIASKIIKQE